uniref:OCEL domain-containing protein n=1 Tax=Knipowitschia caucasica TaxID=637954 RepID=A0AAV2JNI5_KNICA
MEDDVHIKKPGPTRGSRSTQQAPTLVLSETTEPELRLDYSQDQSTEILHRPHHCTSVSADSSGRLTRPHSSRSDLTHCTRPHRGPPPETPPEPPPEPPGSPRPPAAAAAAESQCETGYTTGDTGNEQTQDLSLQLLSQYSVILSEDQRRRYKRDFDSELCRYKSVCSEMDHISDQLHKLSRELDTLQPSSYKYQGVADEYNRLKDLKKTEDYQAKKKQCREMRQKLFHIKRLVKNYDQGMC